MRLSFNTWLPIKSALKNKAPPMARLKKSPKANALRTVCLAFWYSFWDKASVTSRVTERLMPEVTKVEAKRKMVQISW